MNIGGNVEIEQLALKGVTVGSVGCRQRSSGEHFVGADPVERKLCRENGHVGVLASALGMCSSDL